MSKAKVVCPRDGDVLVDLALIVIDDEDNCYRFPCPAHNGVVVKHMDDPIRELLRSRNVPTVEELVTSAASALEDDSYIWRGLLSTESGPGIRDRALGDGTDRPDSSS